MSPVRRAWQMGPQFPRRRNAVLRNLAQWLLARAGWHVEGEMPDVPRLVVIVAPHTTNWDFIVGMLAKWALEFDAHFWAKDSLFRPPMGWFMRWQGGIPVDRNNRSAMVSDTVSAFHAHEQFALALAPEGTRKAGSTWRSGFWHVARQAGVPVCCVSFRYAEKVIRLGPTTMAHEDDVAVGMARMRSYFDSDRTST